MRWSYVLWRLVAVCVVYLFFYFIFDWILKLSIEKSLESVFNAKVEIKKLTTSFIKGSFEIKGVSVGSSHDEFRNLFEFDSLNFNINPKLIFRKKFIIENVSVKGLLFNGKRKTSAKISKTDSFLTPYIKKYTDMGHEFAIERFSEIKKESTDVINIELSQLSTVKIIDEIKDKKIKEYEKIYQDIESMKVDEKIREIDEKIKKVKGEKNFIKQIKLASEVKKEADAFLKDLKEKHSMVKKSLADIKNYYSAVNESRKKDIDEITKLAKIPSFNTQDIADYIFGKAVVEKYNTFIEYYSKTQQLKRYLPEQPKKAIFKEKSKRGRVLHFPLDESYPSFLIMKCGVDGVLSPENPLSFSGYVENITNNYNLWKKPLTFDLRGNKDNSSVKFKTQIYISSYSVKGNFEFLYKCLKIKNFNLGGNKLMFNIDSSYCDISSLGEFEKEVDIPINLKFYNIISSAKVNIVSDDKINSIIKNSLVSLEKFNVDLRFKGDPFNPSVSLKSDLTDMLSKELESRFKKEVDEIKLKLQAKVNNEIDKKLKELDDIVKDNEDKIIKKLKIDEEKIDEIKKKITENVEKKFKL